MIAVRFHETQPGAVSVDEVEEPVAGNGEVLVRFEASALNPADLKIRNGLIRPRAGDSPWVLGWDLVGRVVSGGEFAPGTRVLGMSTMAATGRGTWAELVAMPATSLAGAPEDADAAQLAQLPLAGLTAKTAVETLDPASGDAVLVVGGRGAVGSLVVQLLEARGITPRIAGRGAVVPPASADHVIDAAGTDLGHALRPGGTYVVVVPGTEPAALPADTTSVVFRAPESGAGLAELVRLVQRGSLSLAEPERYPLTDPMAAYAAFERRTGRRVVLVGADGGVR